MKFKIIIYKKWIKMSAIIVLSLLFILSVFNYLLDPLWTFNNFYFTKYKNSYNERILKTNYLVYSNNKYDGILLGSSRSSYLNVDTYEGYEIFNYSCASLQVSEYDGFIDVAKQINNDKLPIVILGMDFFTYLTETKLDNEPIKFFNDTKDIFYRFKMLISYDSFKKAKKNLKIGEDVFSQRVYDKNYNVFTSVNSESNNKKNIDESILKFEKKFYSNIKPIKNFSNRLKLLRDKYIDTKFIIFTTPITKELFLKITNNEKLYLQYENWIKELVNVFGEINNFMFINDISMGSSKNFYDGHHIYPFIGDRMYKAIKENVNTSNMQKINSNNLENKLRELRNINLKK